MNAYLRWNNAIAAHFFNQDMDGRNVYIYVNQGLVSELEQELEPEAGKFLTVVKDGPPWAYSQSICQCAFQAYTDWRDRGLRFPPYIAYLGLFVLAGGADGDFSPNAYYPRLRELLKDSGQGTIPSFDRMWQLWEDLEEWSVFDRKSELGIFRARIFGEKVHIGYPLAQSILTEQERKALPRIFYEMGFDPTSTPPADELARALRSPTAKSLLRSRTVRLVENRRDADMYMAMLGTVVDELAEWDGDVDIGSSGLEARIASGNLRICLEVDGVSGRADASIRCKVNREFPEEGLTLDVPSLNGRFRVEEYLDGWSLPIRKNDTGEVLDASLLNWHNGLTMRSPSSAWQLKLPGRRIRIFIEGMSEGIPGLVEIHALPQGQSFYLAYPENLWPHLERWTSSSQCQGFRELENIQGLPSTWRFASVEEAIGDDGIKEFLSFPPSVRLRLMGGIRSNRGNNFFNFAPPISVMVDGGVSNLDLYCNEQKLPLHESGRVFALPQGLPTESRIVLEARSNGSVLAQQSLFLTGDFSAGPQDAELSLDSTRSELGSDTDCLSIAGAYVRGHLPEQPDSVVELLEDLEAELGNMKGFLIGKIPGQVVEWPWEQLPTDWRPVWAIAKERRKRKVTFLGESLESASPSPLVSRDDRKIRVWKQVLWYKRRQTDPPVLPAVCALWKQFQEVARDV